MHWKKVEFITKTGKIRHYNYWSDDSIGWYWIGAKKP